jgi:enoyl-CoA hydratase/carnithine racemase
MSRVLSRLPGNWGLYLALTGERVCGFELVRVGLVSHYMSTGNLQWVRRVLADQHEAQGAIDALQNVTSLDTIEVCTCVCVFIFSVSWKYWVLGGGCCWFCCVVC